LQFGVGSQLARSTQPLVPERVFLSGSLGGDGAGRVAGEGANGNGHGGDGSPATIATTGLVGMLLQTIWHSGRVLPMANRPRWLR
jgi:hypothetical protein